MPFEEPLHCSSALITKVHTKLGEFLYLRKFEVAISRNSCLQKNFVKQESNISVYKQTYQALLLGLTL